MVATIGMACVYGHNVCFLPWYIFFTTDYPSQFEIPPFLTSCLRSRPLHHYEEISFDYIRPFYQFEWWQDVASYPLDKVSDILDQSADWFKWAHQGSLPQPEAHLETSKLLPDTIDRIITVQERARDILVERISRWEDQEAWVTDAIADYENLVFESAGTDLLYHRVQREVGGNGE